MAKLVKNPIEMQPTPALANDEIGALGEIVETNVRGMHIVSVIGLVVGDEVNPIYSVELWKLPEWASIEDTTYTGAIQLDQALYRDVKDALTCHADTCFSLLEDPIVI